MQFTDSIKIISIIPPSVIKMYLYVYMPLHVSVDTNHHQKANQHRKETTITWYRIMNCITHESCLEKKVVYAFAKTSFCSLLAIQAAVYTRNSEIVASTEIPPGAGHYGCLF
jgi:hypothetical protein